MALEYSVLMGPKCILCGHMDPFGLWMRATGSEAEEPALSFPFPFFPFPFPWAGRQNGKAAVNKGP